MVNRKLQYMVRWRGWDPDINWYPARDFGGAPLVLQKFYNEYPKAAGLPERLQQWRQVWDQDEDLAKHPYNDYPRSSGSIITCRTRLRD